MYTPKICGTCGTKHAPIEPHRTKNLEFADDPGVFFNKRKARGS